MAKETDKYGTIMQAASEALFDLGEGNSRLVQFIKWGTDGAREWHMDMAQSVKTKILTMTDYNAIKTPADYVDWTKIGIKCGNVTKTFTRDNNIALHHDCEDGELIENKDCDDNSNVSDIWELDTLNQSLLFYGTGMDTPLYGLMYKDNGLGYFKEHEQAKEIQLRGVVPKKSKIVLEYISDGWDPDKTTLIHPKAFSLVKKFIQWKNQEFKRASNPASVPQSLVDYWKNEYWDEFDRTSWRMFSLTLEDVLEVQRESFVAGFQN